MNEAALIRILITGRNSRGRLITNELSGPVIIIHQRL